MERDDPPLPNNGENTATHDLAAAPGPTAAHEPTATNEYILQRLRNAPVDVLGRMPWSSNATFLVALTDDGPPLQAVYKPLRGERPLHDFPPGLHRREVATYLLSEALGWDLVPVTVLRHDLPLGEGSLQELIETDYDRHWFTILDDGLDEDRLHQVQRIVAFDVLCNQTDRKSGHVLEAGDRRLLLVDNGLSFHAQFKLRTVLWELAGIEIPSDLLDDIRRLSSSGLPDQLCALLDPFERDAVLARARALLHGGCFPTDPSGRAWPWPLV